MKQFITLSFVCALNLTSVFASNEQEAEIYPVNKSSIDTRPLYIVQDQTTLDLSRDGYTKILDNVNSIFRKTCGGQFLFATVSNSAPVLSIKNYTRIDMPGEREYNFFGNLYSYDDIKNNPDDIKNNISRALRNSTNSKLDIYYVTLANTNTF